MKYCVAANMAGSPTTPVPLSGDFCEQMRKAHEMGYDAIEIHVPDVSVLDIPGHSGVHAGNGHGSGDAWDGHDLRPIWASSVRCR